jgi:streptogramin lyase
MEAPAKKWIYPSGISLLLLLLIFNLALCRQAAASATRLSPISDDTLRAPFSLALDREGKIYVTEPGGNRLLIYSRNGAYLTAMGGLRKPLGVAVDGFGRIYICSEGSRSVSVYNPDLTLSHKLGSGDGEFERPLAVSVSGSGDIYVLDSKAGIVKVYKGNGVPRFSFGSAGRRSRLRSTASMKGRFHMPTAMTIDNTRGEVIVSDLQVITTSSGPTAGARIRVFDRSGVLRRAFGTYGTGAGEITRPVGLAVDPSGKIYVSDAYQGVIHIFSSTGASLDTIYDIDNPLRTPMGVAVGKDRRVFIASSISSRIEVFGLTGYTTLDVSAADTSFTVLAGGTVSPTGNITVTNSGSGSLHWTASSDSGWLTLNKTSGSTGAASSSTISFTIDASGLQAGLYRGNVLVATGSGTQEAVTITLSVVHPIRQEIHGAVSSGLGTGLQMIAAVKPADVTRGEP